MMRRKYILILFTLFSLIDLFSQGVYIGTDETSPATSSILELESDSKGFLIPWMTSAQMLAISNPAEGLMVYCTENASISYYNGTRWMSGDGSFATIEVGDLYQGGVVFEGDGTGLHGKIASIADVGTSIPWGCEGTAITSGNGAESTTDGSANTTAIMTDCGEAGSAAELSDSYSVVDGADTYDDWYLPAEDELLTLYSEKDAVGGFDETANYWTSTENSNNRAVMVRFSSGAIRNRNKDLTNSSGRGHNARAVRTF